MQRFRLLGIALMAIFAIGAIASATAAAENPEILPIPTVKTPLKFTSEGLDVSYVLETTAGGKIKCDKVKNKGEFTTQDAGTATIDFEKCETLGLPCRTEGDAEGIILVSADIQFVDLKKAGLALKESLGVELLPLEGGVNKLIIKCGKLGEVVIEIRGSVLGKEDKIKELVKTKVGELLFDQTKGEQEFKECELLKALCINAKGEPNKLLFESSTNKAGFELAGELALKIDLTFEKEFEVHY